MGKPIKILLSTFAGLLLLLPLSAVLLAYLIEPNDYKPQLIAFVKEKTGRDMEMPGDIGLSFFPWLGVRTGTVILRNTPDFQDRPFATVQQSDVKVKLMPLLNKRIQVDTIVLKGLDLNLIRNRQGKRNWDDLQGAVSTQTEAEEGVKSFQKTPKPSGGEAVSTALAAFAINGIRVEQARIDWDDQENGNRIELTELDLKTDAFSFDRPVGLNMSFLIGTEGARPGASVKLAATLGMTNDLNSFELPKFDLDYTPKDNTALIYPLSAHLGADVIRFDRSRQSLKLAGVRLNVGELAIAADLDGDHMIDAPAIEGAVRIAPFNPARFMKQLNVSVPKMRDKTAFGRMAIQFDLKASAGSLAIQRLEGEFDQTRIRGSGAMKGLGNPAVDFNISLDALDADRYLPSVPKAGKPIASPAVALAAGLSKLPTDALSRLEISGDLQLETLKINGLTMRGLYFALKGGEGRVEVKQSIRQMYQGTYSGDVSLTNSGPKPVLSVNEKIENVQVEPLLKDLYGKARISGAVNASSRLRGRGRSAGEIQSSLTGHLDFYLKDAAVKGLNIQKIIDGVVAPQKDHAPDSAVENDQTIFSDITGTANLSHGLVQNRDLVGRSSRFRVEGSGSANLNDKTLDYRLLARLVKKKAAPAEPEQFHGTPFVIHVGGTFDQPSYTLDVSALLTEKNKAKIEKFLDKKKDKINKLLDKLDKKLGSGTGDLLKNMFSR